MFVLRDTFLIRHDNCGVPIYFCVTICPLCSLSFHLLLFLFCFCVLLLLLKGSRKEGSGRKSRRRWRRQWKKMTSSLLASAIKTKPGEDAARVNISAPRCALLCTAVHWGNLTQFWTRPIVCLQSASMQRVIRTIPTARVCVVMRDVYYSTCTRTPSPVPPRCSLSAAPPRTQTRSD